MNKQTMISIDLNITRFTKDMYENLINMIKKSNENIQIYLYNYIAKKHTYVTKGENINIFNYTASKKKVTLDMFQALSTVSECLLHSYENVYLLCGSVDRDILINMLKELKVKVVLLAQENSSTSLCEQIIIDRILPKDSDTYPIYSNNLNKSNIKILTANKTTDVVANSNINNENLSLKKSQFPFNSFTEKPTNKNLDDVESKLKILLEALNKSKSDALKKEYEKLIQND